jgi:glycosyltransferase involved in cell wall biosynthesis
VTGRIPDVSVVISTCNRSADLKDTIDSLLTQRGMDGRYEVIVVDNNSTDGTREVVQSCISRGHSPLQYLFEGRQGASYGRNAGLLAARAPLVAFTDDDVIVAPDWIRNITRAFDDHPAVDYVNGRILPIYAVEPPTWLTAANSGPCTIRDRGDERIVGQPGCFFANWATANLSFRRTVFDRVEPFAVDFDRGEDLELIVRVWRAGCTGMYAPDVVVGHKIPPERMTKRYHRMWHTREGEIRGRIRYKEIFDASGRVKSGVDSPWFLGTSPMVYRELILAAARWLPALLRRDEALAFVHESQVRQLSRYVRTCYRREAAHRSVAAMILESLRALKSLISRKRRRATVPWGA